MTTPPPSNRIPVNIEDEMKHSYMDYAMSVIIGRALPDIRDGLKPAHRRVLFAMRQLGLVSNRAYRKCATVVGDVIGKYHPHGDAPVYDTLVRLAQDFNMRYMLVDGQGNFGSVDGDPPAAMRYTECRPESLADAMMADLPMETVDFVPNYDETMDEPVVLPAPFPNLLVNGSSGIAVGMATNIPPHNLREVVDAVIWTIEAAQSDQPLTAAEKQRKLLELVPGPDFPTGGYIVGRHGIQQAYLTGRGSILMRAKAEIEVTKKGDRQSIIISAIPYQVNKARLIERMAELVREKTIEGISDLRDESDRDGLRIAVELKRGEVGEVVLNNLYKHTQLQTTFGVIMLAIVAGRPKILTLVEFIDNFIEFRRDVVRRRIEFELRKAEARISAITASRWSSAIARPSRMWARASAFFSSNSMRRRTTSRRNSTKWSSRSTSGSTRGRPLTIASVMTPKVVWNCVCLNRLFSTTSGTSPFLSSMTTRTPSRSDSSRMSEMPSITFSCTSSAIFFCRSALLTW